MKTVRILMEVLKAAFKQDALWLAVSKIVENRGNIKLMKLELEIEEGRELRELQYDIKEEKAKRKLKRQQKRNARSE